MRATTFTAIILTLSGCNAKPETTPIDNQIETSENPTTASTGCTDDLARSTATGAISKAAVQNVTAKSPSVTQMQIPAAAVRNTMDQILLDIEDVRTTSSANEVNMRSCTGRLVVRIPDSVSSRTESALTDLGLRSIADLAFLDGFERENDAYVIDVDYDIQPTDDGVKLHAEVKDSSPAVDFVTKILGLAVYSGRIAIARHDVDAEQTRLAAEQDRTQSVRTQEDLDSAKKIRAASIARINAAWDSMPADAKDVLLSTQRTWNTTRNAKCRAESSYARYDAPRWMALRYACETRANQSRARIFDKVANGTLSIADIGLAVDG